MNAATTLSAKECAVHLSSFAGTEHTCLDGETVVVAPANTQQIAEILRFANTNGISVIPTGGGTKLGWGNPVTAEIRLETKRMNSLREHPWQDMTCTVEAGCTWAAMQTELARHGQMVALDPLWPESATVGGVVATNDSGALRLKYGGLRDLIIGMTIVLADGTIAKTGGKVVKNVAGYDLHKLMTGAFGTLGVIADVHFRLHPVELHARTWTAVAQDVKPLSEILPLLLDSQLTPSAMQLRVDKQEVALDVRIAAPSECIDAHDASLRKICGQIELKSADEQVWHTRQRLFESEDTLVLKASMLPADICAICAELQDWASMNDAEAVALAQATGLVTVALKSSPDTATEFINHFRTRLKGCGGSVVLLKLPRAMRHGLDVWNCDSKALPLMREIKRRFDPNRILNPGRFVGGI